MLWFMEYFLMFAVDGIWITFINGGELSNGMPLLGLMLKQDDKLSP